VPGGQEDHEAVWVSGASLLCCRHVRHQLGEWYRPLLLLHYLFCYLLSLFFCFILQRYFFSDFPLFLQPKTLFRRMGIGKKASKIKKNKNTTKDSRITQEMEPTTRAAAEQERIPLGKLRANIAAAKKVRPDHRFVALVATGYDPMFLLLFCLF
jgi:hypothetical protein